MQGRECCWRCDEGNDHFVTLGANQGLRGGDKWSGFGPTVEMRVCDHTAIQDMYGSELIFPNSYWENAAFVKDNPDVIPAKYATAPIPTDLDRCKK